MKKCPIILFLFILFNCNSSVYSQEIHLGVVTAGSSTWIFNNHITKAPADDQTYIPSFGLNAGVTGEYFINRSSTSFWAGMFVGSHTQKYKGNELGYRSMIQWQKWSFPIVWKHHMKKGKFIEAGFQFASVSEILFTYNKTTIYEAGPKRVLEDYKHNFLDLVVGIGMDKKLDLKQWIHIRGLFFSYGARLNYSLTDLRGVDAYGRDLTKTEVLQTYYEGQYKPTHSAALSAYVGLKYRIKR